MTNNTNTVAGNYPGGLRMTCILDEGAPTKYTAMKPDGTYENVWVWATPLEEGDVVAISNDTANTWAATGGIPLVEKPVNGETLVIGQIVSSPEPVVAPTATDADTDTLAERLTGKYYRTAEVEFWAFTAIKKAVVMHDGSNATVPGTAGTIKFNITSGYSGTGQGLQFDSAASGGVGAIPLHYVAAGTDGDLSNILVGINALIAAVTGA